MIFYTFVKIQSLSKDLIIQGKGFVLGVILEWLHKVHSFPRGFLVSLITVCWDRQLAVLPVAWCTISLQPRDYWQKQVVTIWNSETLPSRPVRGKKQSINQSKLWVSIYFSLPVIISGFQTTTSTTTVTTIFPISQDALTSNIFLTQTKCKNNTTAPDLSTNVIF